MPGVFLAYVNFVKENPQCGLIHSNCYYTSFPYFKKTVRITQDMQILKNGDEAVEKILFKNNIACSSVMVKKECYEKLGGFDENAWVSPDWEMWARIGKHYEIGHLDIVGCAVVIDNKNSHLSAIEVDELFKQQQYYSNKIISYFSENYLKTRPYIKEDAEYNLKRTILKLSIHYIGYFRFSIAISYLKKLLLRLIKLIIMALNSTIQITYVKLMVRKRSYQEIFKILYK